MTNCPLTSTGSAKLTIDHCVSELTLPFPRAAMVPAPTNATSRHTPTRIRDRI